MSAAGAAWIWWDHAARVLGYARPHDIGPAGQMWLAIRNGLGAPLDPTTLLAFYAACDAYAVMAAAERRARGEG